jgi:hypothetical protein
VLKPSVREGFGSDEKFYGEAAGSAPSRITKKKNAGVLKDGEYQEISELIGRIARAFSHG